MMKKELSLLSIFALATGATLSSGFFLLPGLAFEDAGPALSLCYLIALLPLIPAMLCKVELATAMPRAGGVYYFLDRSMGPLVGTIGGIGTWLALTLKTAFALIGMGAYIHLYLPSMNVLPLAAILAVLFGVANLFGSKKAVGLQIGLVAVLLPILLWFTGAGSMQMDTSHFQGFFNKGFDSIIAVAGMVYISYVGVTKVISVSEEVKDPERNLPLGIFLAVGVAAAIYTLGCSVMVGVLSPDKFYGNTTPVADAALIIAGPWGKALVTIAALAAFFAVANAGILSASRYPLAMSRDHLVPTIFRRFNRFGMPHVSVILTLACVLTALLIDPLKIAKLASAFQLLLFAMQCLAVIVMRESELASYDPGFRAPWYPWLQIFGMALPMWMIYEMGWLPMLFTCGLIVAGAAWYFYYARGQIVRHGAIFHVFERMGRSRYEALDTELRGIMKEKGLREQDPFDEVVARAQVLDMEEAVSFTELTHRASELLSRRVPLNAKQLAAGFLEGTGVGATPVSHGAALPHLRVQGIKSPQMLICRVSKGIRIDIEGPLGPPPEEPVYAIFYLVSSSDDAAQHLRILAQLAAHIDNDEFMSRWMSVRQEHEFRELLLRDERFIILNLKRLTRTETFIGFAIREIQLPKGCLIALIRREEHSIVPDGDTDLHEGDNLTIIGDPKGIRHLYAKYMDGLPEDTLEE
ncbi:amino acid permease [Candidatus Sumerlaeota bacterium]|nr:amino acid permease [Candidatus Sumerlaeota bacterium]